VPARVNVPENFKSLFHINKNVASHPYIILCCLVTFLYVSTTQTFYMWFTSYFSAMDIEPGSSSLVLAVYATALLMGMFVKNYLVKFIEEKKLLLASISLSFIFLLLAFLIPDMMAKIILIFLFGISIAGNFSLTFSMGLNVGSRFTSIISGLMHTSSNLGLIIFQFLSGYLSENISKNSVLYIDLTLLFLLIIVIAIMNKREFRYLSRDIKIM
jgi:fucose permease